MGIRRLDVEGTADARAITRINALAWREAYDDLLPDEVLSRFGAEPSDERLREYADRLERDREGVRLAEANGAARGYSYVRWGEETKDFVGADEAGLKEIYVEPDYWGEGIGTALLERSLESLPDDTERLRLEMLDGNGVGRRFYDARAGSNEPEARRSRSPARRIRRRSTRSNCETDSTRSALRREVYVRT